MALSSGTDSPFFQRTDCWSIGGGIGRFLATERGSHALDRQEIQLAAPAQPGVSLLGPTSGLPQRIARRQAIQERAGGGLEARRSKLLVVRLGRDVAAM